MKRQGTVVTGCQTFDERFGGSLVFFWGEPSAAALPVLSFLSFWGFDIRLMPESGHTIELVRALQPRAVFICGQASAAELVRRRGLYGKRTRLATIDGPSASLGPEVDACFQTPFDPEALLAFLGSGPSPGGFLTS